MTSAAEGPAARRRLYVDTSAYLCMLLAEDGRRTCGPSSAAALQLTHGDFGRFAVASPVDRLADRLAVFVDREDFQHHDPRPMIAACHLARPPVR